MAQQYESVGRLVLNGDQQFDIMNLTKALDSQAQDVMTAEGWAGVSFGPGFTQIDITKAVPIAGTSGDLADFARTFVNVQYFTGGKVYEFRGFVFRAQTQGGASQSAQQTAMIKGPFTQPRAA